MALEATRLDEPCPRMKTDRLEPARRTAMPRSSRSRGESRTARIGTSLRARPMSRDMRHTSRARIQERARAGACARTTGPTQEAARLLRTDGSRSRKSARRTRRTHQATWARRACRRIGPCCPCCTGCTACRHIGPCSTRGTGQSRTARSGTTRPTPCDGPASRGTRCTSAPWIATSRGRARVCGRARATTRCPPEVVRLPQTDRLLQMMRHPADRGCVRWATACSETQAGSVLGTRGAHAESPRIPRPPSSGPRRCLHRLHTKE